MSSWLIAILAGAVGAYALYSGRRSASPLHAVAAGLRAFSLTLIAALALNAVIGARRVPPPLVALDVSSSWRRGRDSSAFEAVAREAREAGGDSLLVFGDSARRATDRLQSTDRASRVRPVAERAVASGRALIVYTDGEIDDADALRALPAGSRVVVRRQEPQRDAAVTEVVAPRVAAGGDSVEVRVTVAAGAGGSDSGELTLALNGRPVARSPFDSLASHGERTVTLRFVAPAGGGGSSELRASVRSPNDVEPRNDASSVVVDLASSSAAVLVSTSPDLDSRELAAILRGTVSLPTRAYLRVAPGVWRDDASLTSVSEEVVRRAVRESPIVVLHGDTSLFGPPRAASRGAIALLAPPASPQGEWFATGAPVSPVSTPLSGTPWDSLPPLDVAATLPADAQFEVLEARRARRLDRRVAIVGWERPKRVIVSGASGFWRWRFRGGAGADAFTAVWGSVFDWLAGEHSDIRAAFPASPSVRGGDPIVWRRGAGRDSITSAVITARGATTSDTVTLRFGRDNATVESPPLAPGIYDVRTAGGTSLLAVNPSAELLPRRPTVTDGSVGSGAAAGEAPRARDLSWLFVLAVVLLCGEWLLRRRLGLR